MFFLTSKDTEGSSYSPPRLYLFPDEIIFQILSYLSPEDLGEISCTNRQLNRISQDHFLWQQLLELYFPGHFFYLTSSNPSSSYKNIFIQIYNRYFSHLSKEQKLFFHSVIVGDINTVIRLINKSIEFLFLVDKYGCSPLLWAIRKNQWPMVELFKITTTSDDDSPNLIDVGCIRHGQQFLPFSSTWFLLTAYLNETLNSLKPYLSRSSQSIISDRIYIVINDVILRYIDHLSNASNATLDKIDIEFLHLVLKYAKVNYQYNKYHDLCLRILINAIDNNQMEIVNYILQLNLDLNRKILCITADSREFYITPLQLAIEKRDTEITKKLLAKGAFPHTSIQISVDLYPSTTAIHLAAAIGHVDTLQLLIDAAKDIDLQNIFGLSPLHQAVIANQLKAVELLVNKGSNPYLTSYDGFNVYDYALWGHNIEIIRYLQERNLSMSNRYGKILNYQLIGIVIPMIMLTLIYSPIFLSPLLTSHVGIELILEIAPLAGIAAGISSIYLQRYLKYSSLIERVQIFIENAFNLITRKLSFLYNAIVEFLTDEFSDASPPPTVSKVKSSISQPVIPIKNQTCKIDKPASCTPSPVPNISIIGKPSSTISSSGPSPAA